MGDADAQPAKSKAAEALRLKVAADLKRNTAKYLAVTGDPIGARFDRREAADMDRRAETILTLPQKLAIGAGGELRLSHDEAAEKPGLACIVENPDRTALEASRDRLELADDAQCLALAIDAAETIKAADSLEKMLAHQMAAAHRMSLKLIEHANKEFQRAALENAPFRYDGQLSATRLVNASVRMMAAYQDGLMALHRVRSGGRQVVVVQRVEVSSGGQAIVAGRLDGATRGPKDGRESKI